MRTEAESKVDAVVVTYNPDITVLARLLEQTKPQVDRIIVVDNQSTDTASVERVVRDSSGASLLRLDDNRGLGTAQNAGIRVAREAGATHVLILDQDSVPLPQMVANMLEVDLELERSGDRVAAVGARYVGSHAGNESFFIQFGWTKFKRVFCSDSAARYVRADFLISSGTLFRVAALDAVGDMEEALFIDHVDTEWFLRANGRGYPSYGACDAVMEHGLGESTQRIWLGRWRYVPTHKPFRYYYIFRNSLLLYRRPYAPWKWICNDLVRLFFMFVYYGVLGENRARALPMMGRGIRDGLRGVSGPVIDPAGG